MYSMNDQNVTKSTSAELSEEAKRLRREYNREWARQNKDKKNAINRAYWERKAARLAEQQKGGVSDGNE